MRILPYILILIVSNLPLLGSENNRTFTKDTCNRTYWGKILSTDEERKKEDECALSRIELYDDNAEQYIAHVAYNPSKCWISYLQVSKEHRNQGIGTALAMKAIDDMRANHGCGEIFLDSSPMGQPFWKKRGAKPTLRGSGYVFSDPSHKEEDYS